MCRTAVSASTVPRGGLPTPEPVAVNHERLFNIIWIFFGFLRSAAARERHKALETFASFSLLIFHHKLGDQTAARQQAPASHPGYTSSAFVQEAANSAVPSRPSLSKGANTTRYFQFDQYDVKDDRRPSSRRRAYLCERAEETTALLVQLHNDGEGAMVGSRDTRSRIHRVQR